jgi:transposase InsO family protein
VGLPRISGAACPPCAIGSIAGASAKSTTRLRTARLMRENGLKARQKRRFKRTTDSHHAFPVAPNLIDQDFSADRPNQKWAADIS